MTKIRSEMQLFLEVIEASGEARRLRLDAIEDETLRARVEALVAAHEQVEHGDMPKPPVERLEAPDAQEWIGRDFAGYRIVRLLARGGSGVVYVAEQSSPRREVALKVVYAQASREAQRRFEHEASVLARLEHPGIARVYEAGSSETPFGTLPYLALELIRGRTIDDYVREGGLDFRRRLALLIAVADAVSHAHVRGVIHRDLKPGNILVDDTGQPKVLDFGIARVVHDDSDPSIRTRTGQILGTLPYMSPEQVLGNPDAVDTRTDVYGLGVVAYELLSGRLPLDLKDTTILESVRRIEREEPSPLGRFDASLRGDTETVVSKALRKEKEDRYASASEFGADLRRILAHEPVVARPASAMYQFRKLVRRNRGVFASLAGIILALSIGLIWMTIERNRARVAEANETRAKQAALREATIAQRRATSLAKLNEFWRRVMKAASPDVRRTLPEDMMDVLDLARETVVDQLTDEPASEIALHDQMANVLFQWARYEEAAEECEAASALFEKYSEHEDLEDYDYEKARLYTTYVSILGALNRPEEASRVAKKAVDHARRLRGEERKVVPNALCAAALAAINSQKLEQAAGLAREALARVEEAEGTGTRASVTPLRFLGTSLSRRKQYPQAIEMLSRAATIIDRDPEPTQERVFVRQQLAGAHYFSGNVRKATRVYRRLVEDLGLLFPKSHPTEGTARERIGLCYSIGGDHERALAEYQRLVEIAKQFYGEGDGRTSACQQLVGLELIAIGRSREAQKVLTSSLRGLRRVFGAGHYRTGLGYASLALACARGADKAAAAKHHRRAVRIQEGVLQRGEADNTLLCQLIGRTAFALGDHEIAVRYFERALVAERKLSALEGHPYEMLLRVELARALRAVGKRGAARTELEKARPALVAEFGEKHAHVQEIDALLDG